MKNIFCAVALLSMSSFASKELIDAVKAEDLQKVAELLQAENEESINDFDDAQQTALMHAAMNGNYEVVELLLGKKPNLELEDTHGNTALILATMFARQKVVRLLLEYGAKIDATNKKSSTALVLASDNFNAEKNEKKKTAYKGILKLLLKDGARIEDRLIMTVTRQLGEVASELARYKIELRSGLDRARLPAPIIDLVIKLMGKEDYVEEPEDPKDRETAIVPKTTGSKFEGIKKAIFGK